MTPFALEELSTEVAKDGVSFLFKLSHGIKTPIHGIGGISTYSSDNWDELDDITCRKSGAAISSASENLAKLDDSLQDNTIDQEQINFEFVELDLVKVTESTVEKCKNLHINKNYIHIKLEKQVGFIIVLFLYKTKELVFQMKNWILSLLCLIVVLERIYTLKGLLLVWRFAER